MTRQPAVVLPPGGDSTDRQLLERFVTGEEAAFAALVRRHGAAVLGVCRRELGCEHDAEEVFQAAFLALARRAALVPWQDSVRHWLLAVARRLSLRARRKPRRPGRGGAGGDAECLELRDPRSGPPAAAALREARLILDEELTQLPVKYRAPLVLCYLEGKTNDQAACELGWRPGSMSRRLSRARALLRDRLSRRGLACFVTLGCLALACLWLLVVGTGPRHRPAAVAAAMAPFAPGGECEHFEVALLRAAEHQPVPAEDHDRLARMAQEAVRASDVLAGHDPGPRRQEWRRLSEQMRLSALGLDEALARKDDGAARKAARLLLVSCQACHASFRD